MTEADDQGALRPILQVTLHRFIEAYCRLNVDDMIRLRSHECMHEFLPQTLGTPAMNNDAYAAYMRGQLRAWKETRIHVYETMIDCTARVICVYAKFSAKTNVGYLASECMFWLKVSHDGRQLLRIREFADSAAVLPILRRLKSNRRSSAL